MIQLGNGAGTLSHLMIITPNASCTGVAPEMGCVTTLPLMTGDSFSELISHSQTGALYPRWVVPPLLHLAMIWSWWLVTISQALGLMASTVPVSMRHGTHTNLFNKSPYCCSLWLTTDLLDIPPRWIIADWTRLLRSIFISNLRDVLVRRSIPFYRFMWNDR